MAARFDTKSSLPQTVMRLWQQGDKAGAERLCVEGCDGNPRDAQLRILLAFIYSQTMRAHDAIGCLRQARKLAPSEASIPFNLGMLHGALGQFGDAERCYRDALGLAPENVESLVSLGQLLVSSGRGAEAIVLLRRAVQLRPQDPLAQTSLGNALVQESDARSAIEHLQLAVQLAPDAAVAHYNLGNAWRTCDELAPAIACLQRAVACDPKFTDAYYNLGNNLRDQGQINEALAAYRNALSLNPQHIGALNNLGAVLRGVGLPTEALKCYERVLAVAPQDAIAHLNIGQALVSLKHETKALEYFQRALALQPDYADALMAQGDALRRLSRHEDAAVAYLQLLSRTPLHPAAMAGLMLARQELWDWAAVDDMWQRLSRRLEQHPLPAACFLHMSGDAQVQLQGAKVAAEAILREVPKPLRDAPRRSRSPATRIRLAYVSGDFREHPVARSLIEVLQSHDRDAFSIIGVATNADDTDSDPLRRRVVAACDEFVDLGKTATPQAADALAALDIDIAVDLGGYTDSSRPALLAHRPARVQVNYLGYAGTMGAPWIDYILADHFVIPDASRHHYSEQVAWLPNCFFPTDTASSELRIGAEHTPSRESQGLPAQAVVLCCFNGINRIRSTTMLSWARILRQTPNAILWLKQPAEQTARLNVHEFMRREGIGAERIVFAGHVDNRSNHLARHRCADLYLDSFPYNSHSTARDALAMGLPLLTFSGATFAGRVAGSMLHALGLDESIAYSESDYEARAVELALDTARRAELAARLRTALIDSPLFDMRRFTRELEQCYRRML